MRPETTKGSSIEFMVYLTPQHKQNGSTAVITRTEIKAIFGQDAHHERSAEICIIPYVKMDLNKIPDRRHVNDFKL